MEINKNITTHSLSSPSSIVSIVSCCGIVCFMDEEIQVMMGIKWHTRTCYQLKFNLEPNQTTTRERSGSSNIPSVSYSSDDSTSSSSIQFMSGSEVISTISTHMSLVKCHHDHHHNNHLLRVSLSTQYWPHSHMAVIGRELGE